MGRRLDAVGASHSQQGTSGVGSVGQQECGVAVASLPHGRLIVSSERAPVDLQILRPITLRTNRVE